MADVVEREKEKLRRVRAARAAQLLEARAKAALQARHEAINAASSRASAALAATASRESLLRDLFQKHRLAHEKAMVRARTERTFHRGVGPNMASPTQHEIHRSVSSDQQERKGIHHAAEAAYHAAAAEARAQRKHVRRTRERRSVAVALNRMRQGGLGTLDPTCPHCCPRRRRLETNKCSLYPLIH